MKFLVLILFLFCLISSSFSRLFFQVEPKTEECFYYTATSAGQKIRIVFWVTRGGLRDIDLRITGPNNDPIYSGLQYESSNIDFVASIPGPYKICWNNEMARWTPKVVQFEIESEAKKDKEPITRETLTPLQRSLNNIGLSLDSVQRDQKALRIREQSHRDTAESTNRRVLWYSIIESIVLFSISIGQVYYLRRLFNQSSRV